MKTEVDVLIIGHGVAGMIANYFFSEYFPRLQTEVIEAGIERKQSSPGVSFYLDRIISPRLTGPMITVKNRIVTDRVRSDASKNYSLKIYGEVINKVSIKDTDNQAYKLNWIQQNNITFDENVSAIDLKNKTVRTNSKEYIYQILISTIPLSAFLKLAGFSTKLCFWFRPIYVTKHVMDVSDYIKDETEIAIWNFPDPEETHYRSTFQIIDRQGYRFDESLSSPMDPDTRIIYPGKIKTIDFDTTMFETQGCFLVGRYANWKNKYLASDAWSKMEESFRGFETDY